MIPIIPLLWWGTIFLEDQKRTSGSISGRETRYYFDTLPTTASKSDWLKTNKTPEVSRGLVEKGRCINHWHLVKIDLTKGACRSLRQSSHQSSMTLYQEIDQKNSKRSEYRLDLLSKQMERAYPNEFSGNHLHTTNEWTTIWALRAKCYQVSFSGTSCTFRSPAPPFSATFKFPHSALLIRIQSWTSSYHIYNLLSLLLFPSSYEISSL